MHLNADAVRAMLTPAAILDYYEIARRGNRQLSVRQCPQCGQLKRGSVSIHAENGLWRCHHCGAHGGIFDLVAATPGSTARQTSCASSSRPR
jgi:ribosomal protein L37AE/L43A